MLELNKVYNMDCIEGMKLLPDNSIDSIVTDPPYEIGFMGKWWDSTGIAYNKDMWVECLRVLKPWWHLLAFSGTRTYHRMASAIEDAGFEVRDMIEWCYGSWFPKSLNIGKAVDKLQGNERVESWIKPWHENFVWKKTSNFQQRDRPSLNNPDWQEKYHILTKWTSEREWRWTALKPAHEPICMARKPLAEKTVAENCLKYGTGGINIETSRVTSNSPALQNSQDYENVCNEFSYIQQSYLSSLSDTFFLSHESSQCYLKHIFFVLSPYNNCDTITLHTEEVLAHTFDKWLQDALCGYGLTVQRVDEYVQSVIKAPNFQDDYPTLFSFYDALLQKKVIPFKDIVALSNDVQVYIFDFINSWENITPSCNSLLSSFFVVFPYIMMLINKTPTLYLFHQQKQENVWRFPANLIHDNSEEVRECFPDSKGGAFPKTHGSSGFVSPEEKQSRVEMNDSGNASRFFKSIIYQAKASKSERNNGCEELEDKFRAGLAGADRDTDEPLDDVSERFRTQPAKNNHPTVKPIALMEYLIKMVTKEWYTVLDPFMWSWTTALACKNINRKFIWFELEKEYVEIANARIKEEQVWLFTM